MQNVGAIVMNKFIAPIAAATLACAAVFAQETVATAAAETPAEEAE